MRAVHFVEPIRRRVAVLCGGESHEREISLESGRAVAGALRERGHEVICLDPALTPPEAAHFHDIDVAFLALHGRHGEDGEIQGVLDRMNVIYTGSGAEASRLAFSKSASKERLFQRGVPTPAYVLVHESDDPRRTIELALRIGFPLVVKPDAQGSSLGVSIVQAADALPEALRNCFRYDVFGLLEQAIPGTEWTVSLLDEEPLPLIQIETPREFFDFTAKYEDNRTVCRFDFALPGHVAGSIIEAGQNAAKAVDTKGLARVDIRLDDRGRPWVLEINTIPGLTEHSLVPKSAAHAGVSLGELCERSIERCLTAAHARRAPLRGPHRAKAWRPEPKRA
jgi:D-alanine-D-alanine ligase